MGTRNNANPLGGAADWPLSAADHQVNSQVAQDLINNYSSSPVGGYFTRTTISSLITPANAGIRFYFTIFNGTLTVMLTGVERLDVGVYNDLVNGPLAVSDNLNVVAQNTVQTISLDDAELTNRAYRNSGYYDIMGGMFGIAAINSLLNQAGCQGIRFYFGRDVNYKTIVLYGVDNTGRDMVSYIGDRNAPCPNFCGVNNRLNS